MKNLTEALEAHLRLQKEMSLLYDRHNKLVKDYINLCKESIKDKKELLKYRGIVFSSPSLN